MSSFRRKHVALRGSSLDETKSAKQELAQGVRPSPSDGRLTTSTGTNSLDRLLAGHAGLALGTSLLVEESGTTDFGGSLLRYYASEGVVQGHHVHVLGMGDAWGRDLPGLGENSKVSKKETASEGFGALQGPVLERKEPSNAVGRSDSGVEENKMRIAWRYERLGQFGLKGKSFLE